MVSIIIFIIFIGHGFFFSDILEAFILGFFLFLKCFFAFQIDFFRCSNAKQNFCYAISVIINGCGIKKIQFEIC